MCGLKYVTLHSFKDIGIVIVQGHYKTKQNIRLNSGIEYTLQIYHGMLILSAPILNYVKNIECSFFIE